jgi:hypothetical protein
MSEKRKDGSKLPDATIQLDQVVGADDVELLDDEPRPSRKLPPPLPVVPQAEPSRGTGKTLLFGGLFVLLLGGAIAAGVFVGTRGSKPPPAPVVTTVVAPQPPPPATTSAAAAPAPSASDSSAPMMILAPIEIK